MKEHKSRQIKRRVYALVLAIVMLLSCTWIGAGADGEEPDPPTTPTMSHTVTYNGNAAAFVVTVNTVGATADLVLTPSFGGATPTTTCRKDGNLVTTLTVDPITHSVTIPAPAAVDVGEVYEIVYDFPRDIATAAPNFTFDLATGLYEDAGTTPNFEIDATFTLSGGGLTTPITANASFKPITVAAAYKGSGTLTFVGDEESAKYSAKFAFIGTTPGSGVDGQFVAVQLDLHEFGESVTDEIDKKITAGGGSWVVGGEKWSIVKTPGTGTDGIYIAYATHDAFGEAGLSADLNIDFTVRKSEVDDTITIPLGWGYVKVTRPATLDASKSGVVTSIVREGTPGSYTYFANIEWTIIVNANKQTLTDDLVITESGIVAGTISNAEVNGTAPTPGWVDATPATGSKLIIPIDSTNQNEIFTIKFTEKRAILTTAAAAKNFLDGTTTSLSFPNTATVDAEIGEKPHSVSPTATATIARPTISKSSAKREFASGALSLNYTVTYTPSYDVPLDTFVLEDVVTFSPVKSGVPSYTGGYTISAATFSRPGSPTAITGMPSVTPATPTTDKTPVTFGDFGTAGDVLHKGETLTLKYTVTTNTTTNSVAISTNIANRVTDPIGVTTSSTSYGHASVVPGSGVIAKNNISITNLDRTATWRIDLNRDGALGGFDDTTFYEILPVGFLATGASAKYGPDYNNDSGAHNSASSSTENVEIISTDNLFGLSDSPTSSTVPYIDITLASLDDVDTAVASFDPDAFSDSCKVYKIELIVPGGSTSDKFTLTLSTKYNPDEIIPDPKAPDNKPNDKLNTVITTTGDAAQASYNIVEFISDNVYKFGEGVTMHDGDYARITWSGYLNIMGKSMANKVFLDELDQGTSSKASTSGNDGTQTVDYTSVNVWVYVGTGTKSKPEGVVRWAMVKPTADALEDEELWELLVIDRDYVIDRTTVGADTLKVTFTNGYESKAIHYISFDSKLTGGVMDTYTNEFTFDTKTGDATVHGKPSAFTTKDGKYINSDTIEYTILFNKELVEQSGTVTLTDNLGGAINSATNSARILAPDMSTVKVYEAQWDGTEYVKASDTPLPSSLVTVNPRTPSDNLVVNVNWSAGNTSKDSVYMLVYHAKVADGINHSVTNTVEITTKYHDYKSQNSLQLAYTVDANGGITSSSTFLAFLKTDAAGNPLAGAKFTIERTNNVGVKHPNATSDENGIVIFEDLGVGTYKITETEAPNGYRIGSPVTVDVTFVPSTGGVKARWDFTVIPESHVETDGNKACEESGLKEKTPTVTVEFTNTKGDDGNPLTLTGDDILDFIVFGFKNAKKPSIIPSPEGSGGDDDPVNTEEPTPTPPTDDPTDPVNTDEPTPTPPTDDPTTNTDDPVNTDDPTPGPTLPEPNAPETYLPEGYTPLGPLTLEEYEDGYILFDGESPLGSLTWDDELEEWIFDEDVPLSFFTPRTGDNLNIAFYALTTLACAAAVVVITTKRRKHVK